MTIKNEMENLKEKAAQTRLLTLKTIYEAGSGHTGSALSMVDIITVILWNELNWLNFLGDVKGKSHEEQWQYWHNPLLDRDRFVLSKGHGVPSWYSVLALAGFIEEKELATLRTINSRLQGHPLRKIFPFIDATTGSLAQGQSEAMGYALAKKMAGKSERVYCVMGDGESNEGQVWETAISAPKFKLDNLIVIVDHNKSQGEGNSKDIMDMGSLDEKWQAFGWHVQVVNGHDVSQLASVFKKAYGIKNKPHVIIADTYKGYLAEERLFRGGSHSPNPISKEEYEEAKRCVYGD